jgi:hypothetical protein
MSYQFTENESSFINNNEPIDKLIQTTGANIQKILQNG